MYEAFVLVREDSPSTRPTYEAARKRFPTRDEALAAIAAMVTEVALPLGGVTENLRDTRGGTIWVAKGVTITAHATRGGR